MAKKWSKNSRVATFGQFLDGHYNSVILHPIWTSDPTKMISSSRRIDWWKDLSSISSRLDFNIFSHFWTHGPRWTCAPKTTLRMLVLALPINSNSYLKINQGWIQWQISGGARLPRRNLARTGRGFEYS